jgi:hypothetical protein
MPIMGGKVKKNEKAAAWLVVRWNGDVYNRNAQHYFIERES